MKTYMVGTLVALNRTKEGRLFRLDFMLPNGARLEIEKPGGFDNYDEPGIEGGLYDVEITLHQ